MAAILKIVLFPYLCRESYDFDQIWYADANFVTEDGHLTKKSKFCKFKMAVVCAIENLIFFFYLSVQFWLICAKFAHYSRCRITCKYMSHDQNSNFWILKMEEGCQSFDFDQIWSKMWISIPRRVRWWIVQILHLRWQSDAILKIGNQLYLRANLSDLQEICTNDAESYAHMVYVTKIAIFDATM